MSAQEVGERRHVPVCAIGASAGGIAAIKDLFRHLPEDLGVAYVVIVHLAPDQPSALDQIIAGVTNMPVAQVTDSATLRPNCVYLIPPDRELVIDGDEVRARPFSEPRGKRAPIDMFFRSVASGRGDGLAVILSRTGSDGAVGVRDIKEGGGVVFVQEPKSAEFAMMPRSALAAGVADFVAPIPKLTERMVEVARSKEAVRSLPAEPVEQVLQRIVSFLRSRTGHDFSSYKRATVLRRVTRRMQVTRRTDIGDYLEYLVANPEEAQELFGDLLISVTSFFRDPAAYEALTQKAIGPIFDELAGREEKDIRAWVAGCATGEEAYSLAILFLEEAARRKVVVPIQIFATDLDEGALATAREGRYPASIAADVSEERLHAFFVQEGAHYRIRKEVRDTVLFAEHSVLKDPPFMRLDLISCRNLLIYLDRQVQQQVSALFAYGLRPHGLLFLGSAETVDAAGDLFAPIDRDARIYRARPQASRKLPVMARMPAENRPDPVERRAREKPEEREHSVRGAHLAALEEAAPPSVLVDREYRLLNLSERAGRFLMPSAGPLSTEITALVRPELRLDLRTAVRRAIDSGESTLTAPMAVAFNGGHHRVSMFVSPGRARGDEAGEALIVFLDGGPIETVAATAAEEVSSDEVRRLRDELASAEARLAASKAEHENAIQDLRVANEELQSINEEYRSTSEELETSKEELQSMNEELQTVNAELKSKLDSIGAAHSDLENLVASTDVGTLFLDAKLRIRMFTPRVSQVFNITEIDVGRPITDFSHHLVYDGLPDDAGQVMRDLAPIEHEVATRENRWLMVRVRPYRTVDDRIDGVVVTFVDVTERREATQRLRESERALRESHEKYRRLFDNMDEGYLLAEVIRDAKGEVSDIRYLEANPAAIRLVRADFAGRRLSEVGDGFEEHWWKLPEKALMTGETQRVELRAEPLGQWFDIGVTKIDDDRVAILFQDVTDRKEHERERELMVRELNHRVKNMLAVVSSIARQTMRTSTDMEGFVEAFGERIRSLSRAHQILTQGSWEGADLRDLVQQTVTHFVSDEEARVEVSGDSIFLAPNEVLSLSMALHELSVNALKHGAWSAPGGKVLIDWQEGANGKIVLNWQETGGPEVKPPTRSGFGSRLLERGIARELGGNVSIDYDGAGLKCRIEFDRGRANDPAEPDAADR